MNLAVPIRRLATTLLLLTCLQTVPAGAADWEVITSGQRKWELLSRDLSSAKESICMEYYLFADDSSGRAIAGILMRKAREGIPVQLILENVTDGLMSKQLFDRMEDAGVQIRFFTDPDDWPRELNHRDHRKIVVIDSRVGYVGGMNLSDNYHNEWLDTHLRFEGSAVHELERLFFNTWTALGGGVGTVRKTESLPPGPIEIVAGGPAYPNLLKKYLHILENAQEYVYLQTPYLSPPDTLLAALKATAERGVDVRLLIPAKTDHPVMTALNRSFFPTLLEAGIHVYEYLPCFNHGKVLVTDDSQCWIGSVNLDCRSFLINYEVLACISDKETAVSQKHYFFSLLQESREVTLEETEAWSPWRRFIDRIPRLLKGQL